MLILADEVDHFWVFNDDIEQPLSEEYTIGNAIDGPFYTLDEAFEKYPDAVFLELDI